MKTIWAIRDPHFFRGQEDKEERMVGFWQHLQRYWIFRHVNPPARKQLFSLLKIYDEADRQTARFKSKTGLRCLVRCGKCCESLEIESSVLEVMPLAFALWSKGQGEFWLQKVSQGGPGACCIFCKKELAGHDQGLCEVYAWRPLVCRLFGFSAIRDKEGQSHLVTCGPIKQKYAKAYQRIQQMMAHGFPVAIMTDFSLQVMGIDINLGQKRYPINEAVRLALEKTGLILQHSQ